jgi:ABC-type multidrug transport system fused ATPase/permease subunit
VIAHRPSTIRNAGRVLELSEQGIKERPSFHLLT